MGSWIIPCNLKNYDLVSAFSAHQEVDWKQIKSIEAGDSVLIYIASPVSAVRYRCVVKETELPGPNVIGAEYNRDETPYGGAESHMTLVKAFEYDDPRLSLKALRAIGLGHVQGPRRTPAKLDELVSEIEESAEFEGVFAPTDDPSVLDEVEDELSNAGATSFARVVTNNVQVASDAHPTPMAVSSYCPEDPSAFLDLVSLRDRMSGEPVTFDAGSVVLTEKVATRLGVKPGDTIYVYEQDDIGNATGEGVPLTLTGVSENYIYHYLYVGGDALGQAWGSVPAPDSVLADIPDNEEARSDVAEVLSDRDEVTTVTFNTEQVDSYRKSLRSVNMVVVVLIVAAAALVFIVLYNLTNIQLIERTREIASLKVLGFDRREVAAYVFRETLLLVCLGALIGLGLGVIMEGFVVVTAEVDVVMFGRAIHAPSFAVAFALTIAFSLVVMATLLPKLRAIDMVESLKSVD